MSKVLNVENGNYIVKVESGKNIILDTSRGEVDSNGNLIGEVVINGSLLVQGQTTTVNSQNTDILDNIIVLNKYEDGSGIAGIIANNGKAGIEIDRGENANRVRIAFNESINWIAGGETGFGAFTFEEDNGFLSITRPIQIAGIKSPGTLWIDVGNEIISVTNSVAYEEKIFNYVNGNILDNGNDGILDGDGIPNTQAVVDYVKYSFNTIGVQSGIENFDTDLRVYDFDLDGSESRAEAKIDGNVRFTVYDDRTIFNSLKFTAATITTNTIDVDLELSAPGVASVKIDDVLELTETPHADDVRIDPFAPAAGIKLYSKTKGTGNTGLYFINKSNVNDEIISKNRSILYSMLF